MARRFDAQQGTIVKELTATMRKMNASSLKIDQGDILNDEDTEIRIIFDRGAKRYVFKCDSYKHKLDNMRAAQLTISYLYRALEAYGVESTEERLADKIFDNFLLGFEATPGDDVLMITEGEAWYEILGVQPGADKVAIKNAYRTMARIYHPDNGGTKEAFIRLKQAYEEGMSR